MANTIQVVSVPKACQTNDSAHLAIFQGLCVFGLLFFSQTPQELLDQPPTTFKDIMCRFDDYRIVSVRQVVG
jgi:hypothetical protein